MKYDFTTHLDRTGTGAIKIDLAPEPVKGSGLVPLTIADMEFAVAPDIREAIKTAADRGIYGYTYADGEYKSAVRSWMKRRHGFDADQHKLIVTSGVVPALRYAAMAFTSPDDKILIQPPVYMMFKNAIETSGRQFVENPLINNNGRYQIDFDDFERKASMQDVKLFFLCSPHNPVGRVWTKDELMRLGEICKRTGVVVVADEIHNDLLLNGVEHTVFATLPGMDDITVTCTAVSKTFNLAGLSCSNIFIRNEELADRFHEVAERAGTGLVPYFARAATIAAYTKCEDWLDELNRTVAANFDYLCSYIEAELPWINVTRAEGTYLAWLDMRSLNLDDKTLEDLMIKNGLALDEGYLFGTGGSGFERWNLALPLDILKLALTKLKNAVDSVR